MGFTMRVLFRDARRWGSGQVPVILSPSPTGQAELEAAGGKKVPKELIESAVNINRASHLVPPP